MQRLQTREGFWFNGGLGVGIAGCVDCIGHEVGASGGLSLGGTLSKRVLLGVGTTGWYKSVDGVTVNGGTFDARLRVYPSVSPGFFLTGGAGLGTISASNAFVSDSEVGLACCSASGGSACWSECEPDAVLQRVCRGSGKRHVLCRSVRCWRDDPLTCGRGGDQGGGCSSLPRTRLAASTLRLSCSASESMRFVREWPFRS